MEENKFSWPPKEAEFPAWMGNFSDFVEANAAVLGFTADEVVWLKEHKAATGFVDKVITDLSKVVKEYINLRNIQYIGDPNNAALPLAKYIMIPDFGETPKEIAPNAKATLDAMVKRVATNNDITREQKRSAGVLPKERKKVDKNKVTPELKVTVVNGQAVLDCPLRIFKGYAVYVEDGTAPAIPLGNSTARQYTDARPLPNGSQTQQRTYFIQYVGIKNKPLGNVSNRVTVAVMRVI